METILTLNVTAKHVMTEQGFVWQASVEKSPSVVVTADSPDAAIDVAVDMLLDELGDRMMVVSNMPTRVVRQIQIARNKNMTLDSFGEAEAQVATGHHCTDCQKHEVCRGTADGNACDCYSDQKSSPVKKEAEVCGTCRHYSTGWSLDNASCSMHSKETRALSEACEYYEYNGDDEQ